MAALTAVLAVRACCIRFLELLPGADRCWLHCITLHYIATYFFCIFPSWLEEPVGIFQCHFRVEVSNTCCAARVLICHDVFFSSSRGQPILPNITLLFCILFSLLQLSAKAVTSKFKNVQDSSPRSHIRIIGSDFEVEFCISLCGGGSHWSPRDLPYLAMIWCWRDRVCGGGIFCRQLCAIWCAARWRSSRFNFCAFWSWRGQRTGTPTSRIEPKVIRGRGAKNLPKTCHKGHHGPPMREAMLYL